jgi:hypothetical protein
MALDLFLDVQLLDRKPIIDRQSVQGSSMEEVTVEIESVCQTLGRIDAHHQGPVIQFRQFHALGGQACLAYAAVFAEQQDPHFCILEFCQR